MTGKRTNSMKIRSLIASAAFAASLVSGASPNIAFIPRETPGEPAHAALAAGINGMRFVRCELNGKPCTMLFDTGATHTTFDINFVKRELPGEKLIATVDTGNTNVSQDLSVFHVASLKVGDALFGDFSAIAIDLSRMPSPEGEKLDGVLGMNVIGATRTLLSFGRSEAVFGLGKEAREGFEHPAMRRNDRFDFTILLAASRGDAKPFPVMVDSASTWTFLSKDSGWPATSNTVSIAALDVNGTTEAMPTVGERGILKLAPGAEIEISPLLVPGRMYRIGADTLQEYDMLVEQRAAAFKRNK